MKNLRTLTLILDDELPIVNMLSRVCEQEGHQVRPFMRASEALQCLADEPREHAPGRDPGAHRVVLR